MKLPRIEYTAPRRLADATALLAERHGAVPLAGGQTLLPQLGNGASSARVLVDLARIEDEPALRVMSAGAEDIRVGALVSHAELARDGATALLRTAAGRIGTVAVRTRGTFGGSLVATVPAAEWRVTAAALDAVVRTASPRGVRELPVAELFAAGLSRDELVVEVRMGRPHRAGIAGYRDRVTGTPVLAVAAELQQGRDASLRVAVAAATAAPVTAVVSAAGGREALLAATRATLAMQPGIPASVDLELVDALVARAVEGMA